MTIPPPEAAREPLVRAPAIVIVSLAVLAAVYGLTVFLAPESFDAVVETYGFVPARVQAVSEGTGAFFSTLASFVTYAFLHANFTHLAVNGLGLLIFGTVVARRIGPLRFALFSLVATIASALAHLAANWGDPTPVIGASGAISGYMGAAARFMFIDPRSAEAAARPLLPLWSRPVVIFTLIWTGANVLFGATGISLDDSNDLTAWLAHMGGFFTGLLFFPLFDQRRYWLS